jgi:hypothetical protein
MNKKAISPLISIILVVAISFVLIIMYNLWLRETITEATTRADVGIDESFDCREFKVFVDSCTIYKDSETGFIENVSLLLDNKSSFDLKNINISVLGNYESEYIIEAFTDVGDHTWTVPEGITEVDVLVVGGGGSGASTCGQHKGGGGGAGGLIFIPNYELSKNTTININVGAGGNAIPDVVQSGEPGENSVFDNLIALGGGSGGQQNATNIDGGSGGGGHYTLVGGMALQPLQEGLSGTYGFGNDGGSISISSYGFGGGGAGTPGRNDANTPSDGQVYGGRWSGGDGLNEIKIDEITYNFTEMFGNEYGDIINEESWFAGGGGGGENGSGHEYYGAGGKGGGGRGAYLNSGAGDVWGLNSSKGENGKPNTGGGGGGTRCGISGAGGSGIILIRYKIIENISSYGSFSQTLTKGIKASLNTQNNYEFVSGLQLNNLLNIDKITISSQTCPEKTITINDCSVE